MKGEAWPLPTGYEHARVTGFYGSQNAGRSSLINELLDDAVLDSSLLVDSFVPIRVMHAASRSSFAWLGAGNALQRVSFESNRIPEGATAVDILGPFVPLAPPANRVILEGPPLNSPSLDGQVIETLLHRSDRAVLVLRADQGIGEPERRFLELWARRPIPLAIVTAASDRLALAPPSSHVDGTIMGTLGRREAAVRRELERLVHVSSVDAGAAREVSVLAVAVGVNLFLRGQLPPELLALWERSMTVLRNHVFEVQGEVDGAAS